MGELDDTDGPEKWIGCSFRWLFPGFRTWSFSQDSNGWFILFLVSLRFRGRAWRSSRTDLNSVGSQKSVLNAEGKKRFNVAEINAISIPAYALMLVAMLIFAYLHAVTGWHAVWVIVQQSIVVVGLVILIVSLELGA